MSLRTVLARLGAGARVVAASAELAGLRRRGDRDVTTMPGLSAPVEVLRDRWGVPHVYARNEGDLFQCQGYLHARERLWQMELQRRVSMGSLAEVLGPSAVDSDRQIRVLGLNRTVRQEAEQLDPGTAVVVDAYLRGVNAFLAERRRLPLEMRALRIPPSRWERADVLAFGKLLGLVLSGNWAAELLRAKVVEAVGPETARRLGVLTADLTGDVLDGVLRAAGAEPAVPGVADLLQHGSDVAKGSNCWVAGATRTAGGAPLLACDPHMTLQIPSLWFENHLVAGGFAVTGASLPGAPGVVIGHNADIAWGVTNARVDVQDVFVEEVADGCYRTEDGWRPLEIVREEILVRGGPSVVEQVALTRNGPIVTGLVPAAVTPSAGPPGAELALRWVGMRPAPLLRAVLGVNRAGDWESFRRALADWSCPAQNFLYADAAANIGYALAGTVPVRAAGDGSVPVPGWTGRYSWTGVLSADEMPSVLNPDGDVLVSANNGILGDPAATIRGEWLADYRAARITELLASRADHDVASFARMQADRLSLPGRELAGLAPMLPAGTPLEHAARDLLANWDGELGADSVPGAIYWFLRTELLKAVHADIAGPLGLRAGIGGLTWQPGLEFLEQQAVAGILGDLAAGRIAPEVIARAWRDAIDGLRARWGDDPATWRYGRWHRLELRHPLSGTPVVGRLLNPRPAGTGGDLDTVCPGHVVAQEDGSIAYGGASYRQICDLGDWDASRSVHLPGQSGVPGDPHYSDQTRLWLSGEHHPMPWTRPAVEGVCEHREQFRPGGG
jgi:penicillin amidase